MSQGIYVKKSARLVRHDLSSSWALSHFDRRDLCRTRAQVSQVSNVAVAVFFAGLLLAGNAAAAETLRLGGTGSAIEMLRQVGAQFTAATGVKIDVVFSLGSTGAIRALGDGV